MNKIVFVCENTFDAIMTAVYESYYSKLEEDMTGVCIIDEQQNEFAAEYIMVLTDYDKAKRVKRAISDKISQEILQDLYSVFLSNEIGRGEIIYRYLRVAFRMGKRVIGHFTNDWVRRVDKISRRVNGERHRFLGFVRFKEIGEGILFAKIKPDNNIIEMLAPHFEDRMPEENWIIYDYSRGRACIHGKNQRFYITEDIPLNLFNEISEESLNDNGYAELWKTFFKSIAIKERENPKLQMQHMPKKYRGDIIEMN